MVFVQAAKIITASFVFVSLVEYDVNQLLMLTSLLLFNTVFLYSKQSPITTSRIPDCMFVIGIALISFCLLDLNAPILLFEVSI